MLKMNGTVPVPLTGTAFLDVAQNLSNSHTRADTASSTTGTTNESFTYLAFHARNFSKKWYILFSLVLFLSLSALLPISKFLVLLPLFPLGCIFIIKEVDERRSISLASRWIKLRESPRNESEITAQKPITPLSALPMLPDVNEVSAAIVEQKHRLSRVQAGYLAFVSQAPLSSNPQYGVYIGLADRVNLELENLNSLAEHNLDSPLSVERMQHLRAARREELVLSEWGVLVWAKYQSDLMEGLDDLRALEFHLERARWREEMDGLGCCCSVVEGCDEEKENRTAETMDGEDEAKVGDLTGEVAT